MNKWLSGIIGLSGLGLAAGAAAQEPAMTRAQARLLYAAGGFPISADGRGPTNRCGKAASPKITFVDINGDKRREALFIDFGTCYQPDGRWYAVVTQEANGRWRRIIEGPGTIQPTGTAVNGWFVFNVISAGRMQTLAYNGQSYVPRAATATPPTGPARPAAPVTPGATAARPTTSAAAPAAQSPAARDAAIFRAAGFKQTRRGWESGCDDPSTGAVYGPGRIEQVKDLNGDGQPEALVIEGGTYCYGNTGEAFWLMSQQANGSWKLMLNSTGIAEYLATRGTGGWPDISIGGPGFCFPVVRWNGSAYTRNRMEYEGKPCRRPSP